MNTFCDIGRVYRHIHTDMKWQDTFDAGTEPDHAYCAYFIDAMQNMKSVSISLLETIDFQDVKIPQRYGKKTSYLPKGTPILMTTNNSPPNLFGDHLAMIQETQREKFRTYSLPIDNTFIQVYLFYIEILSDNFLQT